MLTYALGRGIERYDKPVLTATQTKMVSDGYRFSDLILGIADSVPFQTRQAVAPKVSSVVAKVNQGAVSQ
jgi:hypothetical protein